MRAVCAGRNSDLKLVYQTDYPYMARHMTNKLDHMKHALIPPPTSGRYNPITRHGAVLLLLVSLIASDVRGETLPSADAVVDAFHQSLKTGDRDGAAALLAEDLVVLEQGGIDRTKQAYVAGHLNADMDFARAVERRVIERRGGGEDKVHWVLSRYRLTGSYQGARVDRSMVETMILRRTDGRWRISHIHWSDRGR